MSSTYPIGVFDSGVGGLSVLRELRRALPHEDLVYVADSAHVPYGEKSAAFIEARAVAITGFLAERGAKAIVVACNTATGAAIATLRARFRLPIIGMEPAVKPAAARTGSGVIGVLATSGTASSDKFADLRARFDKDVKILVQPCPGLVEQIETGDIDSDRTRALVQTYLRPLLEQRADTIVLGCTHYPFVAPLIQELAGSAVTVIEPNAAVAREVRRRLEHEDLSASDGKPGTEEFWTTGPVDQASRVIARLWGSPVVVVHLSPD